MPNLEGLNMNNVRFVRKSFAESFFFWLLIIGGLFCHSQIMAEIISENIVPLQQLRATFGDMLRQDPNPYSTEFCPDNTCDLFVTKNNLGSVAKGDFIYLYVYFF